MLKSCFQSIVTILEVILLWCVHWCELPELDSEVFRWTLPCYPVNKPWWDQNVCCLRVSMNLTVSSKGLNTKTVINTSANCVTSCWIYSTLWLKICRSNFYLMKLSDRTCCVVYLCLSQKQFSVLSCVHDNSDIRNQSLFILMWDLILTVRACTLLLETNWRFQQTQQKLNIKYENLKFMEFT